MTTRRLLARPGGACSARRLPAAGPRLRRGAAQHGHDLQPVHQHRADAGREGGQGKEPHHLPQGERHQGRPPHRPHQAQHRPRRLQPARVAVHHGVGRGRQDGRLLPQRRRERDLHRQLLVSDRQRRRVVEPHATASRSCSAASAATPRSWPPSSPRCWPARKSSCRAWWTATRTICISVGARCSA